ncbi:MAG: hypothetical protein U0X87_17810 [Anaerolineales bacterium]
MIRKRIDLKRVSTTSKFDITLQATCADLAEYKIPESVNHGDFHDGNILLKNDASPSSIGAMPM